MRVLYDGLISGRFRGKVYRSKLDWIGRFLGREKTVLDLGCVGHDLGRTAVPWLHEFLHSRAKRVVGVDYLPDAIHQMRRDGYEAVCADVQERELNETFDVIVAGDIIEHLDNVGLFLDCCRDHLIPDGVLLVTTPNPVNLVRFACLLLKGSVGANKEHTCWFTAKLLRQLAEWHGLAAAEEAYVDDTHLFYPWLRTDLKGSAVRRGLRQAMWLLGMLLFWRPLLLGASLIGRVREQANETLCLALRKAG